MASKYSLVSRTWIMEGSSGFEGFRDSPPNPPSTNTRDPIDAIACPEREEGAGPIFWNIYHRWSASVMYSRQIQSVEQEYALTGDLESDKVTQVFPVNPLSAIDIDDIVHQRCSMAFPRERNVPNACEFRPRIGNGIEHPSVIVVVLTICATKSIKYWLKFR